MMAFKSTIMLTQSTIVDNRFFRSERAVIDPGSVRGA